MLNSCPSRVPLDVWQSGSSLESTMPSHAHSRKMGSERHSSATLSAIGCAWTAGPVDSDRNGLAAFGTGVPTMTFSPTAQLPAYRSLSYSARPPSCWLSQSMPTSRVSVATRSPLSGSGALKLTASRAPARPPPPRGSGLAGLGRCIDTARSSVHARLTRYVEQKTTSPGATRPTCCRWCSGTTRAYGMSALLPFHCRLYEARTEGAPTDCPGVLVLPRKAGRLPGTDVGRLGASRR